MKVFQRLTGKSNAITAPEDVPNAKSSSDADVEYTYDELLDRVFKVMREKNPDMVAGEKKHIVLKPPQVFSFSSHFIQIY